MTICFEDKDRVVSLELGRLFTFNLCRKILIYLQLMLDKSLGNNTVEFCLYYRETAIQ